MKKLPKANFELLKKRKERGRTFSEIGLVSFISSINSWLKSSIYDILKDGFNNDKPVKKIRMKIEFLEVVYDD